jgi:hypothetical protein
MRKADLLLLGSLLILAVEATSHAATKDSERPDKEMLRMMDFLREMEMIKQVEMMQDLSQVEQVGDQISDAPARKSSPSKRKETPK